MRVSYRPPVKLGSGEWVTSAIRLVRQLDEGAMGSVWIADHTGLGTEVALKFVSERLLHNPTALKRLEGEARAAAGLKSPHIVKIFDYGVLDGTTPYFVMEYLEGQSLRDRLDQRPVLPPHEVAIIVTHTARGLYAAHKQNIVHRDIKPANLFLLREEDEADDEFFVKIVDFGVAKGLNKGVTEPGMLLGTPLYMSREAVVDRHIDHRMDLWALSVVAYEALTSHLPFDGATIDEVCTAIWRGQFTPPSVHNPSLTEEVDRWFAQAFHRERQERPATAKQLANTFVRALASIAGAPTNVEGDAWRISYSDLTPFLPGRLPFSSAPDSSQRAPDSDAALDSPPPPDSSRSPDSSSPASEPWLAHQPDVGDANTPVPRSQPASLENIDEATAPSHSDAPWFDEQAVVTHRRRRRLAIGAIAALGLLVIGWAILGAPSTDNKSPSRTTNTLPSASAASQPSDPVATQPPAPTSAAPSADPAPPSDPTPAKSTSPGPSPVASAPRPLASTLVIPPRPPTKDLGF